MTALEGTLDGNSDRETVLSDQKIIQKARNKVEAFSILFPELVIALRDYLFFFFYCSYCNDSLQEHEFLPLSLEDKQVVDFVAKGEFFKHDPTLAFEIMMWIEQIINLAEKNLIASVELLARYEVQAGKIKVKTGETEEWLELLDSDEYTGYNFAHINMGIYSIPQDGTSIACYDFFKNRSVEILFSLFENSIDRLESPAKFIANIIEPLQAYFQVHFSGEELSLLESIADKCVELYGPFISKYRGEIFRDFYPPVSDDRGELVAALVKLITTTSVDQLQNQTKSGLPDL